MQFDAYGASLPLEEAGEVARTVEELGFSGLWFTESKRTPYLACAVASTTTSAITLGTAIAVAFPRSPMITAQTAWELGRAEPRPVLARAREPGEGPRGAAVLDAVRAPRAEVAGVRPRVARDLAGVPG